MPLLAAAALSAAIAFLALRAGALTRSGAAAAVAVGVGVLWGTGLPGGAVLLAFFVPSSVVSRVVRGRTAAVLDPKGDCRDQWQVFANGAAAALGAVAARAEPALGLWLVTGALAAAGADTWATAWGMRSPRAPRHLFSGRPVPAGTSGGITWMGSLGGVGGAAVVALTAALAGGGVPLAGAGLVAGVVGMFADSALGAAAQGRFHCPTCDQPSEWPVHRCGIRTRHTGGIRWLTNDAVNAAATTCGLVAAWLLWPRP